MDLSSMLAAEARGASGAPGARRQSQEYSTKHTGSPYDTYNNVGANGANTHRHARSGTGTAAGSNYTRPSPTKKDQKHVVFQLIDPEDPRIQARLPMRVMISPHDTTDSIITTVKNFYGLYEFGVSFENKDGISIIAGYDNFENDMIIYVRTVAQPPVVKSEHGHTLSPRKPSLAAPFEMRAPQHGNAQSPSRSAARSAGIRSMSPHSDYGRRSASAVPGAKARPKAKSKDNSVQGDMDGYSSDDGANGSVTSSRRSKTEQVNAEISVDNIVEGGRRKRAFESSELPLFVPPQVPMTASISSISPQRRNGAGQTASPYTYSNQHTFSYTQPLPSPQSYGGGNAVQPSNGYHSSAQPSRQLRRAGPGGGTYPQARVSGNNILPTPDPTVGSVISDEDVALQLMRLGDASNFSHGRTSTSTLDDALSGKAEAPSSEDEGEEDEEGRSVLPEVPRWPKNEVGPQRKKQRTANEAHSDGTSGDEYEDQRDESFKGDSDEIIPDADGQRHGSKPKNGKPRSHLAAIPSALKAAKPRSGSMVKPKTKPIGHSHSNSEVKVPISPASLPSQSRKASSTSTINFQHSLGADEEDLSTKPRCQRCRKSKKGCDRQRPCGRCKDAGIGADGCLSEDEGNGRKGRYGRHMGVPVKKTDELLPSTESSVSAPGTMAGGQGMPNGGYFLAPAPIDKSKKRKR